jgi:hypothetical protein
MAIRLRLKILEIGDWGLGEDLLVILGREESHY